MERSEILEKSRREKGDEGVAWAENNGRRFGAIASVCFLACYVLYTW